MQENIVINTILLARWLFFTAIVSEKSASVRFYRY